MKILIFYEIDYTFYFIKIDENDWAQNVPSGHFWQLDNYKDTMSTMRFGPERRSGPYRMGE